MEPAAFFVEFGIDSIFLRVWCSNLTGLLESQVRVFLVVPCGCCSALQQGANVPSQWLMRRAITKMRFCHTDFVILTLCPFYFRVNTQRQNVCMSGRRRFRRRPSFLTIRSRRHCCCRSYLWCWWHTCWQNVVSRGYVDFLWSCSRLFLLSEVCFVMNGIPIGAVLLRLD